MSLNKKLSVIIPNYNGLNYLKKFLPSVIEQDYQEKEIIIVDNGSDDGSKHLIRKYNNEIILIELDQNYGFSQAVNEGIKHARGEYVILLNNDINLTREFLTTLFQSISQKRNAFSVQSKMLKYKDKTMIDDAGNNLSILGWTKKRGTGKSARFCDKPAKIFSSCAGAAIYKKSLFDEIGYFDESFFAYLEDVDIGYRSRIYGYENWYCPDAVCSHVGSGTTGSRYNSFKVRLSARNNVYLVYKNMPLIQLILNSPFILVGCFIKWFFFVLKGYGKEYRKGFWEGLTSLEKIKKISFKRKHLINYLKIEWLLLKNTFTYFF